MTWIQTHGLLCLLIYWLVSNAVTYMPTPTAASGAWYKWFFGFAHAVIGGLPRVAAAFLPPNVAKIFAPGSNGSTAT